MKPAKNTATNDEVKDAAELLRLLGDFADAFGGLARDLATALDDVGRFRRAMDEGVQTFDLAAFAKDLEKTELHLAKAIQDCKIKGLKLGSFTLVPNDGSDYCYISQSKDRLAKMLEARFKVPFKLKVEQSGWK